MSSPPRPNTGSPSTLTARKGNAGPKKPRTGSASPATTRRTNSTGGSTSSKTETATRTGSASRPVTSGTTNTLKTPVRFQVSSDVYQAALPVYDATADKHCKSMTKTKNFRRHWSKMQGHLEVQRSGEDPLMLFNKRPQRGLDDLVRNPSKRLVGVKGILAQKCRAQPTYQVPRPPDTPFLDGKMKKESHPAINLYRKLFDFKDEPIVQYPDVADDGDSTPELTRTYIKTLAHGESFHRRELLKREDGEWKGLYAKIRVVVLFLRDIRKSMYDREAKEFAARTEGIEEEEDSTWSMMMENCRQSHLSARNNEEVFPTCKVLQRFQCHTLLQANVASFIVDVRWHGDTDLNLCAIVFDDNNRAIGVASPNHGPIKEGATGALVLRPWGDYKFVGASFTGRRKSMEFLLHNLRDTKFHKIVLCVFNGSNPGMPITDIRRAYLTVRHPAGAGAGQDTPILSNTPMQEHVAQVVPNIGSVGHTALVLTSLTRVPPQSSEQGSTDNWEMQCLNTGHEVASALRLIPVLKKSILLTKEMLEELWEGEAQRLHKYNEYFFERVGRSTVEAEQKESFDTLLNRFNEEHPIAEEPKKIARRKRKKPIPAETSSLVNDVSSLW